MNIVNHCVYLATQTEPIRCCTGFQDDAIGYRAGSCSLPFPGFQMCVLDEEGNELPVNEPGSLVVKLPLPPSCFSTLWENDSGFVEEYLAANEGYCERFSVHSCYLLSS